MKWRNLPISGMPPDFDGARMADNSRFSGEHSTTSPARLSVDKFANGHRDFGESGPSSRHNRMRCDRQAPDYVGCRQQLACCSMNGPKRLNETRGPLACAACIGHAAARLQSLN